MLEAFFGYNVPAQRMVRLYGTDHTLLLRERIAKVTKPAYGEGFHKKRKHWKVEVVLSSLKFSKIYCSCVKESRKTLSSSGVSLQKRSEKTKTNQMLMIG